MIIDPAIPKLLNKIRDSKYYTVEVTPMDNLVIPYNIGFKARVNDGQLFFDVLAFDENEAYEKVFNYLNNIDNPKDS